MPFNPDEPRDKQGRWTVGGDTGAGFANTEAGHDSRVLDVGGDKWNQETAARLEKEYDSQRGALDKLAHEAHGKELEHGDIEPETWDDVPSSVQEAAEEKFLDNNLSDELDHEIENWHENGGSLQEAGHALASDDDWKHEALTDFIKDRTDNEEPRIPYSVEQLADAIKIGSPDYDGYKDDEKKPDIEFDNSKLQQPDNHLSPDQLGLPGIDTPKPEESLNEKMREDLVTYLGDKFYEDAKNKSSDMTPPDYLEESAKESLQLMWSQWGDEEKFDFTKNKTDLLDDHNSNSDDDDVSSGTVGWPNRWDPMNKTSGEDYRNTQRMARFMQTERTAQLMKEFGINAYKAVGKPGALGPVETGEHGEAMHMIDGKGMVKAGDPETPVERDDIASANRELWEGWKASSVGQDGKLIQVAAHEELGGRLNTSTSTGISVKEAQEYANTHYSEIGGYEGVKAMLRATWETSQYMLDRADMPVIGAYRGMKMEGLNRIGVGDVEKFYTGTKFDDANLVPADKVLASERQRRHDGIYIKLPTLNVARNGASSWTTDAKVANEWTTGGSGGYKVTLRAEVPRTSVLSVPAYGINIHSEHEVVVMGASWKNWDAWAGHAPKIEDVAIKPHVARPPKESKPKQTKAEKEHVVT